ncbi:MAG: leucine-rich repeat domain-containing protein, partial [Muribaculaceae bacterium]|nr:leucine-rich repeat domain-containing protein [Muribaculaceae bacterium]
NRTLSVISIGESAFIGCSSLTSIEIPNSVTEIESEAFYDCKSLNTLILEYSDKELSIDYYSWGDGNNELKYVTLDRAVSYPMSLPKLKGLVLGEHLEDVGLKGIFTCDKLEAIECHSLTPPSVEGFSNAQYMNIRVSVPDEALETYKQHPVWGKFWNLANANENNISVNPSENKETGRYDLYGRSVSDDYQGMVIIRYSDGSTSKVFVK